MLLPRNILISNFLILFQLVSQVLQGRNMSGAHLNLLQQLSHKNLLQVFRHRYDDGHNLFLDCELIDGKRNTLLDVVMDAQQVLFKHLLLGGGFIVHS